jgi:hypothetical protein
MDAVERASIEVLSRLICIVLRATQLQIVDGCSTAIRKRNHMMQFEKAALGTAVSGAYKRTSAFVASPHS